MTDLRVSDAPSHRCNRCSDGELALTTVPRQQRWVRILGGVMLPFPLLALGGTVVNLALEIGRGSIDSEFALAVIMLVTLITVPFILLGGYLAYPFEKRVWRCTSCGHVLFLGDAPPNRSQKTSLESDKR